MFPGFLQLSYEIEKWYMCLSLCHNMLISMKVTGVIRLTKLRNFRSTTFYNSSNLRNCVLLVKYFSHLEEIETQFRRIELFIDITAQPTEQNYTKLDYYHLARNKIDIRSCMETQLQFIACLTNCLPRQEVCLNFYYSLRLNKCIKCSW